MNEELNMSIRRFLKQVGVSSQKEIESALSVSSDNTVKVTMTLTSTASSNMAAGQYLYDVEIVSGTDVVTRIIEGKITLNREITR